MTTVIRGRAASGTTGGGGAGSATAGRAASRAPRSSGLISPEVNGISRCPTGRPCRKAMTQAAGYGSVPADSAGNGRSMSTRATSMRSGPAAEPPAPDISVLR